MYILPQTMLLLFIPLCSPVVSQRIELEDWLTKYKLSSYSPQIIESGCLTVIKCVHLWSISDFVQKSDLPSAVKNSLNKAALETKGELLLDQWLSRHGLLHTKEVFLLAGFSRFEQLSDVSESSKLILQDLLGSIEYQLWITTAQYLSSSSEDEYNKLTSSLWESVLKNKQWPIAGIVSTCIIATVFLGVIGMNMFHSSIRHEYSSNASVPKLGFLSFLSGKYLSPKKSNVIFNFYDPHPVGERTGFIVEFFQRNGLPYPVCDEDNLLVEVIQENIKVGCSIEFGGTEPGEENKAKVHFTVRCSGEYCISVLINMVHVNGSPFHKTFLPGPPDPLKTSFIHPSSTVMCQADKPLQLFIEPRDRFGNLCTIDEKSDPSNSYSADVVEVTTLTPMLNSPKWQCFSYLGRIGLILGFHSIGCYLASVSYLGHTIQNGEFHIIVLTEEENNLVVKSVSKTSKFYMSNELRMHSLNGETYLKPKKVYCYISPKQLTVREYWLKFVKYSLISFRLCPSTKFSFERRNKLTKEPILVISDGCNSEVELASSEINIIAAIFAQFLLQNIGGSETFKDKQNFFYDEVRRYHKNSHSKLPIKIDREMLLESSYKATRGFSKNDWCKNFEIQFVGEEGLDWGGLRREWFELLCFMLFDPQNLLFHTFENYKQGLIHPTPAYKRPHKLNKLKYYEFAGKIVGKCLYESSLGGSYRQLVKAKFSRSFLAQLIGLKVHYKYFEQDDPELYVSKIKYILENDVDTMGLNFIDEEYNVNGKLVNEVELISGGASKFVTNKNKLLYLDALAQHRLANSVKVEMEAFLKGLNELIPDNLLCIFDENELELLLCGTGNYSIADFKANHAVSGSSYEFKKVLDWFWMAVSNFTEEEMARLLQFTTGCSQLPPGGFAELIPKFHITAAPTFGNLPTAHTCFNQLCLPDYDSYDQFERALRLSLSEGSEGFGLI